ncbi:CD109 antigen-like [Watersipora subatra]|uniref:CD109 antigen-like n=1 Tax=Watersipora subatra TaxID=2589382 RepID=UPI00355B40DD
MILWSVSFLKVLLYLTLWMVEVVIAAYIQNDATYSVLAPTQVRPNQKIRIAATAIQLKFESMTITARLKKTNKDGSETVSICEGKHTFSRPGAAEITMQTPSQMSEGNYSLVVAGYSDADLFGQIFINETEIFYDNKQVSVFIITSKPFYNRGELVEFKVIPITKDMMPITDVMDIRIRDPVGNILREWWALHTNAGGVVSLSYRLNKLFPRYGKWTIEVTCLNHVYTKDFTIDEFYLPFQYVNISMPTSMISSDAGISGRVDCVYTTFKSVRGNATIQLDIISPSTNQEYLSIVRTLDYFFGYTDFKFSRQEMEDIVGGENNLVGKELRVTVSVKEWVLNSTSQASQSAMVYSKVAEIRFLEGSVITFKPGLPFNVHLIAYYGDGTPLPPQNPNRTVYIEITEADDNAEEKTWTLRVEMSLLESRGEITLHPNKTTKRYFLTAKYENIYITKQELIATRYWSATQAYLHVTTSTKKPRVREYMSFSFYANTFVEVIYYAIVSGGSIVHSDSLQMYKRSKQLSIALSQDMAPSARIVAYYITPEKQVISDSLNFHIDLNSVHQPEASQLPEHLPFVNTKALLPIMPGLKSPGHSTRGLHETHAAGDEYGTKVTSGELGHLGEVDASINKGKDLSLNTVELKLAADPLSYVAFGAMEYQLYNYGTRNSLSEEEVITELYTYDGHANSSVYYTWEKNGQYAGSISQSMRSFGHDANSTFFYSGLYIFTDANVSAVYTHCNRTKGEFPCMDGMTCYNQQDICNGRAECAADHRDEMGCEFNKTRSLIFHDDVYWRTRKIRSNSANPGFMWGEQYVKPDGMLQLQFPVWNYPSSWVVTAIAMSRKYGLAILKEPVLFDGTRPLFIRVEAPGSIKLYEHLSLSIVVFNRWHEAQDVLIVMKKSLDYDPVYWDKQDHAAYVGRGENQILVSTLPNTERQIYVPITFNKAGTIEVTIEAMSSVGYYKHTRKIKVTWQGVPELYITNYQVDLRVANSEHAPDLLIPVKEDIIDPELREMNYVAGSPASTLHVVGDIIGVGFAPEYKNYLTGRKLIDSPDYSLDNALFNFAMNWYSLRVLHTLSTISASQADEIIESMNNAMQEIFSYQMPDGSFRAFRWSQKPCTWVTAHFVEIMSEVKFQAQDFQRNIQIPQNALDRASLWLTKQHGLQRGIAIEFGTINNKWLESKLYVEVDGMKHPSNVSLTALVVLGLTKSVPKDQETQEEVQETVTAAKDYLSEQAQFIDDPFEMSVVAYALSLANHPGKGVALKRLKEMRRSVKNMHYWSTMEIPPIEMTAGLDTQLRIKTKQILNVTGYSVSATSYALHTLILNNEPKSDIEKVQKFLQEQRMYIGGWTSSWDTLIATQALSILAELNQDRNAYDMTLTFRSDQDPSWYQSVHLDKDNWFIPQKISLPTHWGTVQTFAKGHGVALVQMKTTVNYEHQRLFRKSAGELFDIHMKLWTSGFNHSIIHYKICPVWKGPGERSGVAMVDFTVPSGYVLPNGALQAHVRKTSPMNTIRNGESRGSQTTIYFDYLDRTENNCVTINAGRRRTAANITQNHRIRVFDFFEPGIYTQRIIDRVEFNKLTVCLACGSYQCNWCPDYASGHMIKSNLSLISVIIVVFLFYRSHHTQLFIIRS